MTSCETWDSHPAKLTFVYGLEKKNAPPNMNMLPYLLMTFSLHAHAVKINVKQIEPLG